MSRAQRSATSSATANQRSYALADTTNPIVLAPDIASRVAAHTHALAPLAKKVTDILPLFLAMTNQGDVVKKFLTSVRNGSGRCRDAMELILRCYARRSLSSKIS